MGKYFGKSALQEVSGEPVGDLRNPNWRWAEMWRVLVVYKTLLSTTAAGTEGNGYAVTEYLSNLGNDALSKALFPPGVRELLINNENIIVPKNLKWVGHPSHKGPLAPLEGIRITSGLDMRFKQECPVGPLSIEACFILATQLAGINWKTLNTQINEVKDAKLNGIYWMNAIVPHDNQDSHIREHRPKAGEKDRSRNFGYLSRRAKPVVKDVTTGSTDAGFSLVVSTTYHIYALTHKF